MGKNVLIISSSLRTNSNSECLAHAFENGAAASDNQVEFISLKDKKLGFCKGCLACQAKQNGHCIIRDDADAITQKMLESDVLVFATPIYYYEMSGQLKTMLDRANPMFPLDYRFWDVYVLTAAAEDSPDTPQKAISGIEGWISCFEKAHLAGSVFAGGVNAPGEVGGHSALENAYSMGKSI